MIVGGYAVIHVSVKQQRSQTILPTVALYPEDFDDNHKGQSEATSLDNGLSS
jgi:hypothetical protein